MRRLLAAVIVFIFFASSAVGAADLVFHPPQTEAERVLDDILKTAGEDRGDMLYFALNIPGQKKDFSHLFSKKLLQSWRSAEKERVHKMCNGSYRMGELCGFDYNPIVCGQDIPEYYLYRTQTENAQEVLIASVWPPALHDRRYEKMYRLTENKTGGWILDGVDCGEGEAFNMN